MLTKLLLTSLVVLIAWRVLQQRKKTRPPLYIPATSEAPATATRQTARRRPGARTLALGVSAILLAAIGWFMYNHWYDAQRLVEIRVTNTTTGEVVRYSARKGEVNASGGAFTTLAGNQVILASVERMEIVVQP